MNPNILSSTLTATLRSKRMLLSLLVITVLALSACGGGTHTTQKSAVRQVALQDSPYQRRVASLK